MKKIFVLMFGVFVTLNIMAQPIDSLTAVQATTHKVVRLKLNETIDQVNTNMDSISTLDTEKADLASPTFTGTVTLPSNTSIGDVSNTEIGYLNNVTSAIQTQFSGKVNIADSVNYASGYMSRYDGVEGLATKVNLADSVNYANGYMSRSDGVTGLALKVNIADSSGFGAGHYATTYDLFTGLAAKYDTTDAVTLENEAVMLADSFCIFVFGFGSTDKDTANAINNAEVGSFVHLQDTLKIKSVKSLVLAGSGTETIGFQIYYGTTYGTKVDSLFSPAITVVSHTGVYNIPDEATQIPPGTYVWGVISGVSSGNKPGALRSYLNVYKSRTL